MKISSLAIVWPCYFQEEEQKPKTRPNIYHTKRDVIRIDEEDTKLKDAKRDLMRMDDKDIIIKPKITS